MDPAPQPPQQQPTRAPSGPASSSLIIPYAAALARAEQRGHSGPPDGGHPASDLPLQAMAFQNSGGKFDGRYSSGRAEDAARSTPTASSARATGPTRATPRAHGGRAIHASSNCASTWHRSDVCMFSRRGPSRSIFGSSCEKYAHEVEKYIGNGRPSDGEISCRVFGPPP